MNSNDILSNLTERWEKSGLKKVTHFSYTSNSKRLLLEFKKKISKLILMIL